YQKANTEYFGIRYSSKKINADLLFAGHGLFGGGHNIGNIQPVFFQQFLGGTAFTKGIFGTYILDGYGEMTAGALRDGIAQSTNDIMLFRSYCAFGFANRLQYGL